MWLMTSRLRSFAVLKMILVFTRQIAQPYSIHFVGYKKLLNSRNPVGSCRRNYIPSPISSPASARRITQRLGDQVRTCKFFFSTFYLLRVKLCTVNFLSSAQSIYLGSPRIDPGAAGQDARRLSHCAMRSTSK